MVNSGSVLTLENLTQLQYVIVYPLPRMDDILRKLQKARYISTMDLSSAYHQISMKGNSRAPTAFTVPGMGLFQFKRMPYGLHHAGAIFQRLIDMVIGLELETYAFSYLVDIIVATATFAEHTKWLKRVLLRIKVADLTISHEKRRFCREEVKFLCVLVNRDGFKPVSDKIKLIIKFTTPKNLKQLRRLMDMTSWYRKFLKNFSKSAEPLAGLIRINCRYI